MLMEVTDSDQQLKSNDDHATNTCRALRQRAAKDPQGQGSRAETRAGRTGLGEGCWRPETCRTCRTCRGGWWQVQALRKAPVSGQGEWGGGVQGMSWV